MECELTVHEHALTGGGAGVVHSAACGYLHAAQAQLVVALVDAGVLHIELGDTAQGTQDSSARCTYLLPASQGQAATFKSCMQPMPRLSLLMVLQAPLQKGMALCAERLSFSCLLSEWLLLHLYGACVGFMLLVETQQTYAIARVCMSFLL